MTLTLTDHPDMFSRAGKTKKTAVPATDLLP